MPCQYAASQLSAGVRTADINLMNTGTEMNAPTNREWLDRYVNVYRTLEEAKEVAKDDLLVLNHDASELFDAKSLRQLRKLAVKVARKQLAKYMAEHKAMIDTATECQLELGLE